MIAPQDTLLLYAAYVAVFVGALLAFEGLRQALSPVESDREARNRRMRLLAKGATTAEVLTLLKDQTAERGLFGRLAAHLQQSGLPLRPSSLIAIMALLGAVAFLVLSSLAPVPVALPAALVLAVAAPLALVGVARSKRLDKLTKQLPDALDLMARGLKVGHPLNVTVAHVATEMPDPIGTEFGIIQDQISYGDSLVEAFADFADRIPTEDARYLAVSVGIQHGSGGNLARVLGVLSKVIRDRAMMRKKIHAISAEGRFSAIILSCLPFAIFGMISLTSPGFYGEVRDDTLFLPIMGVILSLIVVQALLLYKMVNFKF